MESSIHSFCCVTRKKGSYGMKIVIVGNGKLGFSLAQQLVNEYLESNKEYTEGWH